MPDLFPDPELRPPGYYRGGRRKSGFGFGRLVALGLTLLVVAGGVTYFILKQNVVIDEVVPTLQAEAGPIKERPADPGGVEVLHQDTTIYDRLDRTETRGRVEQLLPPAEKPSEKLIARSAPPLPMEPEPLPVEEPKIIESKPLAAIGEPVETRSVAPAAEPKPAPATPEPKKLPPQPFLTPEQMKAAEKSPRLVEVKPPVEKPAAPKPVAEKPPAEKEKPAKPAAAREDAPSLDIARILANTAAAKETAPEPAPEPEEQQAAAPAPEATAPAPNPEHKGMARVQLASSTDRDAAEKKMMDMVSKHATLLRSVKLTTIRADLGARGIYYRIQTQPMPPTDAGKLCSNLKAARLDCLVVKAVP